MNSRSCACRYTMSVTQLQVTVQVAAQKQQPRGSLLHGEPAVSGRLPSLWWCFHHECLQRSVRHSAARCHPQCNLLCTIICWNGRTQRRWQYMWGALTAHQLQLESCTFDSMCGGRAANAMSAAVTRSSSAVWIMQAKLQALNSLDPSTYARMPRQARYVLSFARCLALTANCRTRALQLLCDPAPCPVSAL